MDTNTEGSSYDLYFALEVMQHTGSFTARGAQDFIRAHREQGSLPDAGVTIASGAVLCGANTDPADLVSSR
ncbi:hypothetical protein [Rhodococcus sp. 5G237]